MNRMIEWIKTHPIPSFPILALGLMYILVFPALYLYASGLVNTQFSQIFLLVSRSDKDG